MSDKPEQHQEEAGSGDARDAAVDMLNEIMDRSMPQIPDPPEWDEENPAESSQPDQTSSYGAPAKPFSGFVGKGGARERDEECPPGRSESERTLPRRVSRETSEEGKDSPSPSEKSRSPSSAYVYLAILFGAAFLMLLLAYFVQQRNSDAVRDDLRTTTASRQELLENIQQLEKEKKKLQQDNDLHEYATTQARELYESKRQEVIEYDGWLSEARSQLTHSIVLGYLERFINEKDYLMAACIVQDCDHFFNERNHIHPENSTVLPTQAARYLKLRDWLEDHGHVLIQQHSSNEDGSGATEQPMVALPYTFNTSQETRDLIIAAKNLWPIFWYYAESPSGEHMDAAAMLLAGFCDPELSNNLNYLNTKNFQPSTIELFEQIKADLMERGMLVEVDGVIKHAQNGRPIDIPTVWSESNLIGDGFYAESTPE